MNRMIAGILIATLFSGSLIADDWAPDDDTFDPNLESVVIGNRSWIGDPSPFECVQISRTGYTHVNATNFEGFPPAVQISLMVPLEPGETKPPAGGMLMFDKAQTAEFVKLMSDVLKKEKKDLAERIQIKTTLKDADWALVPSTDKEQRFVQLENKSKEKVDTYRFSLNAAKKLLGAVEHSLKSLEKKKSDE